MLDKVAGTILLFKNFILVAVPVQMVIMTAVWLCTRRFSWSRRRRVVYGWFLNRTDRELLFTGAALSQFLFVLAGVLTGMEMEPAHLLFLILTAMIKLAVQIKPGKTSIAVQFVISAITIFLRDLINSALIFASLLVGNILLGYLRETRFNIFVATVYVLLGMFLVLYQGYFYMKDLHPTERSVQS